MAKIFSDNTSIHTILSQDNKLGCVSQDMIKKTTTISISKIDYDLLGIDLF